MNVTEEYAGTGSAGFGMACPPREEASSSRTVEEGNGAEGRAFAGAEAERGAAVECGPTSAEASAKETGLRRPLEPSGKVPAPSPALKRNLERHQPDLFRSRELA